MLWLKTSGRSARTMPERFLLAAEEVGRQDLDRGIGHLGLQGADGRRVVGGALVLEVVAVDRGDDDVLELHLRGRVREAQRLERVRRVLRPAGVHVAVAACARAGVAEDLEGGGAAPPALGDVRAASLFADRVQVLAVDELLHVEVARIGARGAHLHPLRATRPFRYGQRLLHVCQSTDRGSRGAAREHEVRPSPRRRGVVRHECAREPLARHVDTRRVLQLRGQAALSGLRDQPQRPASRRADGPLPPGERAGGLPGAGRRVSPDRRRRGAHLEDLGLLPLPARDRAHHRRRGQRACGRAGRGRPRPPEEGARVSRLEGRPEAQRGRRERRRTRPRRTTASPTGSAPCTRKAGCPT